jgi:predicted SAM-dependent methyltransferase
MIRFLRNFQFLIGLKRDLYRLLLFIKRFITRRSMINAYFFKNKIKKLHIGSSYSTFDGWLCSDIRPVTKESIYLDATKRFPFQDGVFQYVYSEHMIEHISRLDGQFMLQECFRVLEKNGKLRIATPDLGKIVDIYAKRESRNETSKEYVEWITDNFVEQPSDYNPMIVLNTLFRNWGHSFLYDADFLEKSLYGAGFSNVTRQKINCSEDINLKGIEQHHLNVGNREMVEFETMIFEAQKI